LTARLAREDVQKHRTKRMLHFNFTSGMIYDSTTAGRPRPSARRSRSSSEIHKDALLEYAQARRAFTLQEVASTHPETSLSRLFEVARSMTKSGTLRRLAKGVYISSEAECLSEEDAEALKQEAENFENLADPLLQHLDSPRLATELCALMGTTSGTISQRADRLQEASLMQRRVIGGRLYYARSKAALDKLEAEGAEPPSPAFGRILDALPDDELVERNVLLTQKGIGPNVGARQLQKMQGQGLVETCCFNQTSYVFLTELGRTHPKRSHAVDRLAGTDWARENYAKRLGILMVLDLLQPLCLREIKVATLSLATPFGGEDEGKRVAATIKRLLREGFLDWADAEQDPSDPYALLVCTEKSKEIISLLRRFAPYPDQERQDEMRQNVEEKRRKRQARQRRRSTHATSRQIIILSQIASSSQQWRRQEEIEARLPRELGEIDLRRTLAALCERGLLERASSGTVRGQFAWRITPRGRAAQGHRNS
jgi:hypothetical protein